MATVATSKGEPHEGHVALAVRQLAKLSTANRPKTTAKLASALFRRGCCRLRLKGSPSPGELAKAMLAPLGAVAAPKELVHIVATFAEVAALAQSPCKELPNDLLEISGKVAAQALNESSGDFIGKPIDIFAKFLCSRAFFLLGTSPDNLVKELAKRDLISFEPEGVVKYNGDKLVAFKADESEGDEIDTEAWLSTLLLAAAPRALLQERFAATLGDTLGLPYVFLGCTSAPIPGGDLQAFRSKFGCSIAYKQAAGIMKVKRTTAAAADMDTIKTNFEYAFGKEPAFVCKVNLEGQWMAHIIGKGGRFVKQLESAHGVRLSVVQMKSSHHKSLVTDEDAPNDDDDHLVNRLGGWLSPGSHCRSSASDLSKELAEIAKTLRDKVRHDIDVHLEQISETTASIKHGSTKPALRRTFSSEYTQMKSDREAHRAKVEQKKKQRKEHLASKDDRLHTKRGRRKERDKGPATHGGRHKMGEADVEADA